MPTWRDDKLLELANQLSYSPADKRREQLRATIELLPTVDPQKSYPWDFVHFRITGFQLRAHAEHVTAGKVLRADLATLIEFLSDTLSIKVEDAIADGREDDEAAVRAPTREPIQGSAEGQARHGVPVDVVHPDVLASSVHHHQRDLRAVR